jgi:hypothetical protein
MVVGGAPQHAVATITGICRSCNSPRAHPSPLLLTALRIVQIRTTATALCFLHALQGYELVFTLSLSASPLRVTVSNAERDQSLASKENCVDYHETVWLLFAALQAAIRWEMRTTLTSSQTELLRQDADTTQPSHL